MLGFFIGFLFGDSAFQYVKVLPPIRVSFFLILITLIIFILHKKIKLSNLLIGLLCGFMYTHYTAYQTLRWSLPREIENKPITVVGEVVSIPIKKPWNTSFTLLLESINKKPVYPATYVMISWGAARMRLQVGDRVEVLCRLKRPHGLSNPGGQNQETWYFYNKIRASGKVIHSKYNKLLSHSKSTYAITSLRESIYHSLLKHLPDTKSAHWLPALIVGVRGNIPQDDWEILRKTGTNHLMAIAGLHIGVVSVFTHKIAAFFWRRSIRLLLWFPMQLAAAVASLAVAVFYSALAGFSIPTQRASIMLSIYIITLLLRQQFNPWCGYGLAVFVVLIINPLDVISDSFWLSFLTMALILYGMGSRLFPTGLWWKWFRIQWVIGIGLIPVSVLLFHEFSWVSFVANSVTIPILSFLVLPCCLLYMVSMILYPPLSIIILQDAAKILDQMWSILIVFSRAALATSPVYFQSNLSFFLTLIGVILLLLPAGLPGRWLGLIFIFPLFLNFSSTLNMGEYRLSLLDVGQGLSAVVQTKSHLLIFDTGMKLSSDYDMGKKVVIPYLQSLKTKKIDELVLSHGDNDHIGGAEAIMTDYPILSIHTSVPQKIGHDARLCLSGTHWNWDGVIFTFIHPDPYFLGRGNDSSCVLKIDNGKHTLLLTGDIERRGEIRMLSSGAGLQSDILIAPHHGSKTSGIQPFMQAVHPKYVFYATGYLNRYHFPHPSVKQDYDSMGAISFDTAKCGAIIQQVGQETTLMPPVCHRELNAHYWYTA